MNTRTKLASSALGVTGLALASLAAGGGVPASASATCEVTVHSNKVLNLEDRDNTDEIFFKLGARNTPIRQYALNQRRVNIGSEVFQNSIDVKVFERDGANLTQVGVLNNVPCQNNPGELTDVAGSGAVYRVRWSVS